MNQLMGWCQSVAGTKPDAHHNLCPGTYKTQVGVTVMCSCPNHSTSLTRQGVPGATDGRLRGKKSAPGGATNTVAPGASPTGLESTVA